MLDDLAPPLMLFSSKLKLDPAEIPANSSRRSAAPCGSRPDETQDSASIPVLEVMAWPHETDGDVVYVLCRQQDTRLTNEVPFIFAGVVELVIT